MPSHGGSERVVAEDAQPGTLDWSSDGEWLVYSAAPDGERAGFWVQSPDGGPRHHVLATTELDEAAQFSPDGHVLAFMRVQESVSDVYVVALDPQMRAAGEPRRVTSDGRIHGSPRWLSTTELVFTTGVAGAGSIDRISMASGQARPVMAIDASGGIDVAPSSGRLVISQNTSDVDIRLVELTEDGTISRHAGQVIASSRYDAFPVYSPDGERIAFASTRSGSWQVWASNQDGSHAMQLTSLRQAEVRPVAWTPSGQQLGLLHNANGAGMRAYMVDAAGGTARTVPELESVSGAIRFFWWSLDGRWIVYSTRQGVWKVPTGGGNPEKLTVVDFVPTNKGSMISAYDPVSRDWQIIDLNASIEESIKRPPQSTDRAVVVNTGVMGGLPSGVAWPGGRMRWSYYLSAGPESFPAGWIATEYGGSRSPNGRTELHSSFVAVGADLVLLDNFK